MYIRQPPPTGTIYYQMCQMHRINELLGDVTILTEKKEKGVHDRSCGRAESFHRRRPRSRSVGQNRLRPAA